MSPNETLLSAERRKLLEKYRSGGISQLASATAGITRHPAGMPIPLALAQEQVWRRALAIGQEVPSFYNESFTIHRLGDLDINVLQRSFTEVIRRHEVWRTTFRNLGEPVQVIHPVPTTVSVPHIDLRQFREEIRASEAIRVSNEHARLPFDLEGGPLLRAIVVTASDQDHRIIITIHQSIVDGLSVYRIFPSEFTSLYEEFSIGKPSPLPELGFQYADFAYSNRELLRTRVWDEQIAYWREQLADLPSYVWPNGISDAAVDGSRGTIQAFTLSAALYRHLQELCRREGVTLFMTLLAGFAVLLAGYTRGNDVAVGTVAPSGRKHPEVQSLLGYFLNPVALRINLSLGRTVRDLLRQCREVTLGALANDDVPFELLLRELKLDQSAVPQCLLPMAITLAPKVPQLTQGWHQTPMDTDSGWARWALYLELSERSDGLLGRAQYSTDYFTPGAIEALLQRFNKILRTMVVNAEGRIGDLLQLAS